MTGQTGLVIPLGSPDEIRDSLRRMRRRAWRPDPGQIDAKADAAFRRAHTRFTWEYKAQQVVKIYQWARDPRLPKPVFPIPWPD